MSDARYDYIVRTIEKCDYVNDITETEILSFILKLYKENNLELLVKYKENIINLCTFDFEVEDCIVLMILQKVPELKDYIKTLASDTYGKFFESKTKMFLYKITNEIINGSVKPEKLFDTILQNLEKEDTMRSSELVYNLCVFNDFRKMLMKKYPLTTTIITAFMRFDREVKYKGGSIIGKLLQGDNEKLVIPYAKKLLGNKKLNAKNIEMIGGGGSSLVFKINGMVLKLGETRNNKYIFINHRIAESKERKVFEDENENILFYLEIMNYVLTGDVTLDELEELKYDLLRQGLNWNDVKLENSGVLQDWDTNDSYFVDDKELELATKIDNPIDREEFNKRDRRVVLIDNDNVNYLATKQGRINRI